MTDSLKQLLDALLPIIATALVSAIGIGINKLLAAYKDKLSAENAARVEQFLHSLADTAVTYAEEQAHKALKSGNAVDGQAKMQMALEFASEGVKQSKLKIAAPDQLSRRVEAAVNRARASRPR